MKRAKRTRQEHCTLWSCNTLHLSRASYVSVLAAVASLAISSTFRAITAVHCADLDSNEANALSRHVFREKHAFVYREVTPVEPPSPSVDDASTCPSCRFASSASIFGASSPSLSSSSISKTSNLQRSSAARIIMATTKGWGRTGNYVHSMFNAMHLAFLCGGMLELPKADKMGHAFDPGPTRFFDFTPASGSRDLFPGVRVKALNATMCKDTKANAFYFAFLDRDMPKADPLVEGALYNCLRHYLGFCEPGFCRRERVEGQHERNASVAAGNPTSADDAALALSDSDPKRDANTVVAHIRQGDIYPKRYSSRVHPGYAQPPLSFYLSIFNRTRPSTVVLVGEKSRTGPVWEALQMLHEYNVLAFDVQFQSSSTKEDLRTMVCAKTIIESRSTLMLLTRLGFAERTFTSADCHRPLDPQRQQVFRCSTGPEFQKHYARHTNNATEWVDALLTRSFEPTLCDGSSGDVLMSYKIPQ